MKKKPVSLVLDFGGVISKTMFESHRQTEKALGLPAGALKWQGSFDPGGDPLWRDMIADKITERDYWLRRAEEVGSMLGKNWTSMQEFVIAARSEHPMEIIRPEFLSALERAKAAGVRPAILSNELDLFYGKDFRGRLPFLKDFETIVDATYTKILKPDPGAYSLVCEALDLEPEDCVFVDDQARNINGARDFGMHTVHFDVMNPEASYKEALNILGVK